MDIRELTVAPREGVGKGVAKRLRRAGKTPGILYGGASPMNIAVDAREIFRITHGHEGSTQLLKVSFDQTSVMAIIRDMQFDPVSDNLVHIDLQEVAMDKPIQVTVALHHVGEAIGVRETQGILEMVLREIQVSTLPGNIPELIEADVTKLAIDDFLAWALGSHGPADADLDPSQLISAQRGDNGAHAVVAARAAPEAQADLAER